MWEESDNESVEPKGGGMGEGDSNGLLAFPSEKVGEIGRMRKGGSYIVLGEGCGR